MFQRGWNHQPDYVKLPKLRTGRGPSALNISEPLKVVCPHSHHGRRRLAQRYPQVRMAGSSIACVRLQRSNAWNHMGEFFKGGICRIPETMSFITKTVIHDLDDLGYPPFRKPPYKVVPQFGIAKLVQISPISLWFRDVYGRYNYS